MAKRAFQAAALILPKLDMAYAPDLWNEPIDVAGRNCFAYALDELRLGFAWPGALFKPGPIETSKSLLKDGFIRIRKDEADPKLNHIFAYENRLKHFVRRDGCGQWSHKNGGEPATNRDYDGKLITDLDQARLSEHKFSNWEYYIIPKTGVKFYPQTIRRIPIGQPGGF